MSNLITPRIQKDSHSCGPITVENIVDLFTERQLPRNMELDDNDTYSMRGRHYNVLPISVVNEFSNEQGIDRKTSKSSSSSSTSDSEGDSDKKVESPAQVLTDETGRIQVPLATTSEARSSISLLPINDHSVREESKKVVSEEKKKILFLTKTGWKKVKEEFGVKGGVYTKIKNGQFKETPKAKEYFDWATENNLNPEWRDS